LLPELWERIFHYLFTTLDLIRVSHTCVTFHFLINNNDVLLQRCRGPCFFCPETSNLGISADRRRAHVVKPIGVDYPSLDRQSNIAKVNFQGNPMRCVFQFELEGVSRQNSSLADHTSICVYHQLLGPIQGKLSSVPCAFFADGQFDTFGEVKRNSWMTKTGFNTTDVVSVELCPKPDNFTTVEGNFAEQIDLIRYCERRDEEIKTDSDINKNVTQQKWWTVIFRVNGVIVYDPVQFMGVPLESDGFSIGVFMPVDGTAVKIIGVPS